MLARAPDTVDLAFVVNAPRRPSAVCNCLAQDFLHREFVVAEPSRVDDHVRLDLSAVLELGSAFCELCDLRPSNKLDLARRDKRRRADIYTQTQALVLLY